MNMGDFIGVLDDIDFLVNLFFKDFVGEWVLDLGIFELNIVFDIYWLCDYEYNI